MKKLFISCLYWKIVPILLPQSPTKPFVYETIYRKKRYELNAYLQTGKNKDEIAALLLLEFKILNKFSFSEFIMVQRTNITKKAAYYCKNAE